MEKTAEPTTTDHEFDIKKASQKIVDSLDKDREREIISRRFGLIDRRETLEQVGELLGITRERVRQLEKAILKNLVTAGVTLPGLEEAQRTLLARIKERGGAVRAKDLINDFIDEPDRYDYNHITFLGTVSPGIVVIPENDDFYQAVADADLHDDKTIKGKVKNVVSAIKEHGKPIKPKELRDKVSDNYESPENVAALASISKKVANLKDDWGLVRWPLVNPKNIRDKIYIILRDNGKPMHFNKIAKAIKGSDFKRKDVTQQAIHNELIKDDRFVLIGRGIYALKEWGYKQGTVSDVIAEVLKENDGPMHRDDIVKQVLKKRDVKETTILLNLQGKPQFERVSKATYQLSDNDNQEKSSDKKSS